MENKNKIVVFLKKKIQVIMKENWKSKKVPTFTKRPRKISNLYDVYYVKVTKKKTRVQHFVCDGKCWESEL